MQLDVRAVAVVLKVPESTVYRWINEKQLPAKGVEGQFRVGRTELLEWATTHKIDLSPGIFSQDEPQDQHFLLAEALEAGGIFYDVPGVNKDEVFHSVVDNIPLPDGCPADLLLELFLAREASGSTAVGNGVAIPHPRHPVVLPVGKPLLSLCFLAQPIEFGAANGEPVRTLFVLLSPTVKTHLQMLARIAVLLRDDHFGQILSARKSRREILADVRRVEETFDQSSAVKNGEH